jgi:hypothetical protein
VEDSPQKTIFRLVKTKTKSPDAKQLLKYIEDNFHTLPFTERWLQNVLPPSRYKSAFKELLATKAVMGTRLLLSNQKNGYASRTYSFGKRRRMYRLNIA